MPHLICTVRDCGHPLAPTARAADAKVLRCESGHAFDRARQGYWNLLQPQDRKALEPGDRAESVDARERWLQRGHVQSLADRIARLGQVADLPSGATVLDIGCGTGWFAERLSSGRNLDVCGLDLSSRAIRSATRRLPEATWVVVNADRGLPLADASVHLAISVFGRRPATELERVLRPGGRLVVAVPADDDLAELREAAQGQVTEPNRIPKIAAEFANTKLHSEGHETWRQQVAHDHEGIDQLLAMTYRAVRRSQQENLRSQLRDTPTIQVTLAAHLLSFTK